MTPLTWLLTRLFPYRPPSHEQMTVRLREVRFHHPATQLQWRVLLLPRLWRNGVRNGRQ